MSNQYARNNTSSYITKKSECFGGVQQTTGNGTADTIIWSRPSPSSLDDIIEGSSTFNVLKSGVFTISVDITYTSNATGYRQVYFDIDGQKGCQISLANTSGESCLNASWTEYVEAGKTIIIKSVQTSGANLDVLATSNLAITYLG